MSGQTSAVAGHVDEVATDQVSVTHPGGDVDFHSAKVAISPTLRYNASVVARSQTQPQQQLLQKGHDATAARATTAQQILTSRLHMPPAAATPLHATAAEVVADTSNVLELSPPHPLSRCQQPSTSSTILAAPAVAMAPAIIPWAISSSGSALRPSRFVDRPQQRVRTTISTPSAAAAAAADLNSSTVRPSVRYPPGFPVTPGNPLQQPMQLQQVADVPQSWPSSSVTQQAWSRQHQQYHEEPCPPRPPAPEPPSPPATAAGVLMPQWPTEPFEHQQLDPQPPNPGGHYTLHLSHPTTIADRDAVRIITALEQFRHEMHKLSNCLACVAAPRSVVLLPCKHLALCEGCAVNIGEANQSRVQDCCHAGAWVDFSAEGPPSSQAAADTRWSMCPVCGAEIEDYIAGVQVPV